MNNWLNPLDIKKPNLIYLDTWVYRFLIDNKKYIPKMLEYLKTNVLFPAISDIIFAELNPHSEYHETLNALLPILNSVVVRNMEYILNEEVKDYPNVFDESIMYPNSFLSSQLFSSTIMEKLSSEYLTNDWKNFRGYAKQMERKLQDTMYNYPKGKNGKYSKEQAEDFTKLISIQWLSQTHPKFIMSKFTSDSFNDFKNEVFKTLQLFGFYIFYKYYIGKRKLKKISDFGDLVHLYYIPYSEIAILERDQCSILRKIQNDYKVCKNIKIKNIDFIKSL